MEEVEALDQVQALHPVVEIMEVMETLQFFQRLHLQPVEEVLNLEVRQVLLLIMELQVDRVVE